MGKGDRRHSNKMRRRKGQAKKKNSAAVKLAVLKKAKK